MHIMNIQIIVPLAQQQDYVIIHSHREYVNYIIRDRNVISTWGHCLRVLIRLQRVHFKPIIRRQKVNPSNQNRLNM